MLHWRHARIALQNNINRNGGLCCFSQLLGGQRASDNQEPEETDEDLADLFG